MKQKPATPRSLLTIAEFAELTQSSVPTIRDFIDRKIISVYKVRRWIRVPREQALRELEKYKVQAIDVNKGSNL